MLEENIDRWLQQRHDAGLQEGLQKGREEGLDEGVLLATRNHLSKLMTIKFGPREGRDAKLEALEARPLEVLELALERILSADTEAQLWA